MAWGLIKQFFEDIKDRTSLLTVILADATNLGLTKMAESCPGCVASATSGKNVLREKRDFDLLRESRRGSEVYQQTGTSTIDGGAEAGDFEDGGSARGDGERGMPAKWAGTFGVLPLAVGGQERLSGGAEA